MTLPRMWILPLTILMSAPALAQAPQTPPPAAAAVPGPTLASADKMLAAAHANPDRQIPMQEVVASVRR